MPHDSSDFVLRSAVSVAIQRTLRDSVVHQAVGHLPPPKGPALSSKQPGDALAAASAALAAASSAAGDIQPIFKP